MQRSAGPDPEVPLATWLRPEPPAWPGMNNTLYPRVNLNALNTRKMPPPRLQTCTAHFHSTQRDCLSQLTWLVKSYPSLLMGNTEGQKTKYNGPSPSLFFTPSEQQILNSKMTRQSRLKRLPEKRKLSKAADL